MKTALLNLQWGRPGNFENQLRQLKQQTVTDFDLIVSNSNRKHDTFLENVMVAADTPFETTLRNDSNDRLGFRRFDIARELPYDRYIFLDDDVTIGPTFIEDMLAQYEPNTYHSWYCWTILSDNYHDRNRVFDHKQPIHYAGTGISMIDRSIVDRPELFDAPPAAYYIEDLWLTYVVDHVYGWKIKHVKIPQIKLGGADDVALYKRVSKMEYRKIDFYRDLVATGWKQK
jgi:hypothetical protein